VRNAMNVSEITFEHPVGATIRKRTKNPTRSEATIRDR